MIIISTSRQPTSRFAMAMYDQNGYLLDIPCHWTKFVKILSEKQLSELCDKRRGFCNEETSPTSTYYNVTKKFIHPKTKELTIDEPFQKSFLMFENLHKYDPCKLSQNMNRLVYTLDPVTSACIKNGMEYLYETIHHKNRQDAIERLSFCEKISTHGSSSKLTDLVVKRLQNANRNETEHKCIVYINKDLTLKKHPRDVKYKYRIYYEKNPVAFVYTSQNLIYTHDNANQALFVPFQQPLNPSVCTLCGRPTNINYKIGDSCRKKHNITKHEAKIFHNYLTFLHQTVQQKTPEQKSHQPKLVTNDYRNIELKTQMFNND